MIGAGHLDTRCIFQKATEVSDGGGGYTTTWATQFEAWGGFSFPTMRSRMEQVSAGAIQTVVAGELIIRDSAAARLATKEWRVITNRDNSISPASQDVWNIRKAHPRQRDGFLRFAVEAGVAT